MRRQPRTSGGDYFFQPRRIHNPAIRAVLYEVRTLEYSELPTIQDTTRSFSHLPKSFPLNLLEMPLSLFEFFTPHII
jgi:hypothetical protein